MAEERARVKVQAHMLSDVGVVRDHNEDAALVDSELTFFIVADGMGGHAAGEVASGMAVETVREQLEEARPLIAEFASHPTDERRKAVVGVLEQSVRAAHNAVYERGSAESDKQGMGTTLDVVLLAGTEALVAHVGDSRTYLVRDNKVAQITTDHTVAEVLVIEGKLSLEEAQISPLRTILVNAIGVAPDVGVEMAHVRLRAGDRLLLSSDGLHDYFPVEQEIADQLKDRSPEEALRSMVDLAKGRGGHDNITGVLVDVLEAPAEQRAEDGAPRDPNQVTATLDAASDGVPQEVARDDTLPVEKKKTAAAAADRAREREESEETLKSTLRLKPLRGEAPTSKGDKAEKGEKAEKATEAEKATSEGKDGKRKRKRRWRLGKSKGEGNDGPPDPDGGDDRAADDDVDAHSDTDPGNSTAKVES